MNFNVKKTQVSTSRGELPEVEFVPPKKPTKSQPSSSASSSAGRRIPDLPDIDPSELGKGYQQSTSGISAHRYEKRKKLDAPTHALKVSVPDEDESDAGFDTADEDQRSSSPDVEKQPRAFRTKQTEPPPRGGGVKQSFRFTPTDRFIGGGIFESDAVRAKFNAADPADLVREVVPPYQSRRPTDITARNVIEYAKQVNQREDDLYMDPEYQTLRMIAGFARITTEAVVKVEHSKLPQLQQMSEGFTSFDGENRPLTSSMSAGATPFADPNHEAILLGTAENILAKSFRDGIRQPTVSGRLILSDEAMSNIEYAMVQLKTLYPAMANATRKAFMQSPDVSTMFAKLVAVRIGMGRYTNSTRAHLVDEYTQLKREEKSAYMYFENVDYDEEQDLLVRKGGNRDFGGYNSRKRERDVSLF